MSYYNFKRLTSKPVIHGIYCIQCSINEINYLGKAKDIWQRAEEHKRDLKAGTHDNKELQADFNKYGIKNFTFKIIEEIDSWEILTNNELLVELAYTEWYYIFDVYFANGKKLYNNTGLRERSLWHIIKSLKSYGTEIKSIRKAIESKFKDCVKLDIYYVDDNNRQYCIDLFDKSNELDIKTYEKHKKYCEENNINFTNFDPRALFGLIKAEPQKHVFNIIVDNFNEKK